MENSELIQQADQDKAEKELQLQKDMANHFMEGIRKRVLIAAKAH